VGIKPVLQWQLLSLLPGLSLNLLMFLPIFFDQKCQRQTWVSPAWWSLREFNK